MHRKAFFSLADMIVEYADDDCRVSDLASQPVVLQMNHIKIGLKQVTFILTETIFH